MAEKEEFQMTLSAAAIDAALIAAQSAILHKPQTLTPEQKRQARANIGVSDPIPQGSCSYGGVVLPRLPESKFPCAFIYSTSVERFPYGVFFTQTPVTYDGRYLNLDGIVGRWHYNEHDGWCSYGEYDATGHLSSDPIIWTSHAILDKSGNLYKAASQPVCPESGGGSVVDAVLYIPQTLTTEQKAQARENIGADAVLIDLDTYGETPVSLILSDLFRQGGGVRENVDIGNLMDALLTDNPLRVQFTFGVNVLYAYGVCVGRVNNKAVQLNLNAMFTYQGKTYVAYVSIDTPSADEAGKANISMSVEEPGELQEAPVQSVNGQTGAVHLSATDVGARPDDWMPTAQEVGALPNTYTPPNQTAEQVGADPKGTADAAVSQHNIDEDSHNDIRLELKAINDRLTAFFDSDNQTLDELSEIVAYITSNKSMIDAITTSKVSVTDIINNLTTNVSNKPLSAAQGVVLKDLIDTLSGNLANYQPKGDYALRAELPAVPVQSVNGKTGAVSLNAADVGAMPAGTKIPSKTSELDNDSGYITDYTETDPTVPAWAKSSSKPSYSKSEVGLGNVDNVKQYSASNPPPYPVTSVNGKTGTVRLSASDVGASEIYSAWESVAFEEVTGYVIKTTRYIAALNPGKYMEVVVDKYAQLKVTGFQWDSSANFALCSFFDDKQAHISSVNLTTSTQYTDYVVDVPANAFTVAVNGKVGNAMSLTGLKKYDCGTLAEEKANRIARWVTPVIEVKDKTIIAANGKSELSQNDGELGIADVSKYKKVIVSGWQYDLSYGFDVCCFYDAAGNLLSSHQGPTSAKKTVLTLDVPANAVTIKVTGNRYQANVSIQGYQVFDVNDLYEALKHSGKKLITLGDSITALGTGSTGWVKYFLEKTDCELVANVAVNGAWLNDKDGTTYDGNPVFNGTDNNVNNVLGNQVQKIINNNYSAPDIIIIAIGTNSGISITKDQIKAAYYDSSNTLIPLANVDRKTSAGAYRWCLEKLHEKYPNAIIFWCTPIMGYQTTRSAENAMAWAESLRIATEYTGQMMIDTIRCGINGVNELSNANGQYLVDGLHPNANGAKKIGYYNAAKVIPFLGNSFTLT